LKEHVVEAAAAAAVHWYLNVVDVAAVAEPASPKHKNKNLQWTQTMKLVNIQNI